MIASSNHQPCLGEVRGEQIEGLDHEFETLVGAPFAKRENPVKRRSPAREIRELRATRKQAVSAQMHIVAPVLVIQDLAISRHEDRD